MYYSNGNVKDLELIILGLIEAFKVNIYKELIHYTKEMYSLLVHYFEIMVEILASIYFLCTLLLGEIY